MVFIGTYEHSIDTKNRLAIPAEIRSQIQRSASAAGAAAPGEAARRSSGRAINLYVTLGEGQSLCLYTEWGFEQRANELDYSELDADELLGYEQMFFSLARVVEVDKQGRVRLPEHLLKQAKLGTEVVILGVKDHLEVRDRTLWIEHVDKTLVEKPNLLRNPRRAMRKGPRRG